MQDISHQSGFAFNIYGPAVWCKGEKLPAWKLEQRDHFSYGKTNYGKLRCTLYCLFWVCWSVWCFRTKDWVSKDNDLFLGNCIQISAFKCVHEWSKLKLIILRLYKRERVSQNLCNWKLLLYYLQQRTYKHVFYMLKMLYFLYLCR